jgi:hypothetical protein
VSWHSDQQAFATDSFTLNWGHLERRTPPPPFTLVPRTLNKVQQGNATVILVAPIWLGYTFLFTWQHDPQWSCRRLRKR